MNGTVKGVLIAFSKLLVLGLGSIFSFGYCLRIGYWMTGDMHSGGRLAGLVFWPLFLGILILAVFFASSKVRRGVGCFLLAYSILVVTLYLIEIN
jgi:hypothetical protein